MGDQCKIAVGFATVQSYNGGKVLDVFLLPFALGAVDLVVGVPGINEQNLAGAG